MMLMKFRYTDMTDITMILPLRMVSLETRWTDMIEIVWEVWFVEESGDALRGFVFGFLAA